MEKKRTLKAVSNFMIAFLFIILCTVPLTVPALAEESSVVRSFSVEKPAPNEEFAVTLTISGLRAAGIVETVPEGFTYAGVEYPEDERINISGQNLIFSVLDDRKITYIVKAPASGSGTFKGRWNDILNQEEGTIKGSEISVDPDSKVAEKQDAEAKKSPAGATPVLSGIISAAFVAAVHERVGKSRRRQ